MKRQRTYGSSKVTEWRGVPPRARIAPRAPVSVLWWKSGCGDGGTGTATSDATTGLIKDDVVFLLDSGQSVPNESCSGVTLNESWSLVIGGIRGFRLTVTKWPDSTQRTFTNAAGGAKIGQMLAIRGLDVSNFPASIYADDLSTTAAISTVTSGVVNSPTYVNGTATAIVFGVRDVTQIAVSDIPNEWDDWSYGYSAQGAGWTAMAVRRFSGPVSSALTMTNASHGQMRYLRGAVL